MSGSRLGRHSLPPGRRRGAAVASGTGMVPGRSGWVIFALLSPAR